MFFTNELSAQQLSEMEQLEVFVKNMPPEAERNFDTLHTFLSSVGNSDSIKISSFFLWMVHHIQYDFEAAMAIDKDRRKPTVQEILQSKSAICTGYSSFFQALCKRSNIPCLVLDGYTKNFPTSQPELEAPDHSWNVVKINGAWCLMDVTWAASIAQNPKGYPLRNTSYYFKSSPPIFLLDHLPSNPLWQLLSCPITPTEFRKPKVELATIISQKDSCYALKDSLIAFEKLNAEDQKINSLQRAYSYNPTPSNGKELGHAYMDRFLQLSEKEKDLETRGDIGVLLQLYPQLLLLAKKAERLTPLYDWQKENLAYTFINYAVALSRSDFNDSSKQNNYNKYQQIEDNLLKARSILQTLPPNPFIEQGLSTCEEYLQITKDNLDRN